MTLYQFNEFVIVVSTVEIILQIVWKLTGSLYHVNCVTTDNRAEYCAVLCDVVVWNRKMCSEFAMTIFSIFFLFLLNNKSIDSSTYLNAFPFRICYDSTVS